MLIDRASLTAVDWANITNKPSTVAGYGITDALKSGQALPLYQASVAPASPVNGWKYYNTTTNKEQSYINGSWVDLITSASGQVLTTPTINGTMNVGSTPKILANNTKLTIEANSSVGQVHIRGSYPTNPGVIISKTATKGAICRFWDETSEPSTNNFYEIGYKVNTYTNDILTAMTGYYNSINMQIIGSSDFGLAWDSSRSGMIDFYPLGRDGTMPTKWTKAFNGTWGNTAKTVCKEYGDKTEYYPDNSASTFLIGSATLLLSQLPTYANEAAAVTGGLAQNRIYKTSTGEIRIKL